MNFPFPVETKQVFILEISPLIFFPVDTIGYDSLPQFEHLLSTHCFQDSQIPIDLTQGPPGSCIQQVKGYFDLNKKAIPKLPKL